jgi:hypothetical protein
LEKIMTHDEREATFRAFYMGKDAIPGDKNPFKPDTPEWRAWDHGFASEYGERVAMSDDEVKAAFAELKTPF